MKKWLLLVEKRIKIFLSIKALANYQDTLEFLLNASKLLFKTELIAMLKRVTRFISSSSCNPYVTTWLSLHSATSYNFSKESPIVF